MASFPVQIQSYPHVELFSYFLEPALFPHSYCLRHQPSYNSINCFILVFHMCVFGKKNHAVFIMFSTEPAFKHSWILWLFLHLYNCLINDLVIFSIFIFFYQIYIKCHDLEIPLFSMKNPYCFPIYPQPVFLYLLFCPPITLDNLCSSQLSWSTSSYLFSMMPWP